MTYLSASRKNGKNKVLKIIVGVFIVAVLSYFFVPHLYDLLSGVFKFESGLSINSADSIRLQEENSKLQREIIELKAQVNSYEALNTDAKKISNDRLLAKVIKRPPNTLFDTLILDRGRIDGVDVGMMVYTNNTLLGRVKNVFENTSSVDLVTYPGNLEQVVFPGNIEAEIKGVGNGGFEASLPKNVNLSVGDPVFGSDRNATLYGVVDKIDDEEGSVYHRVFIDSPFNLYKESWVEIKTK